MHKEPITTSLASYLREACHYFEFPKLSFGVFQKGNSKTAQIGLAHGESSLFKIGSLTKVVTALAVLKLQEQGLLKLNDNVKYYFPWFNGPDQNITILDLLLHTASLPRGQILKREPTIEDLKLMFDDVEAFSGNNTLKTFKYSNLGYILLGFIIERVSGESFGIFTKRNIFSPLEMTGSGFGTGKDAENVTKPHALTYFSDREEKAYSYKEIPLSPAPAASFDMFSDPADFLKLLACILNDGLHKGKQIFARISIDMLLNTVCAADHNMDSGMGFFRVNKSAKSILFQNGEHWGHSAAMLIIPEIKFALIAMTDRGSAALDLAFMLQNISRYLTETQNADRLNFNYVDAKKLAGNYTTASGMYAVITEINNSLYISIDEGEVFPLIYKGQQYFIPMGGPLGKYFVKIDLKNGKLKGLCAGPLYFVVNEPFKNPAPTERYNSMTGIYISKGVGRVALYERNRELILAYSPFKEAVLTEIIGGVFNQTTGPFVNEQVAIDQKTGQMTIGQLLFTNTNKQY